jgi:transcriptional regulator NrdR family protein
MKCPVCGVWTLVKETRRKPDNQKWRRYECGNEHRFWTTEQVLRVIKPKEKKG